jgi:hypothetical protein
MLRGVKTGSDRLTTVFQPFSLLRTQQLARLLWEELVATPEAKLLDAFDTSNAGGRIGTQNPAIRRLAHEPANGPEPEIDRTRS